MSGVAISFPGAEVFESKVARKALFDRDIKDASMILFELRVRTSLKGYKYLRSAIKIALNNSESIDLITKIMYPAIASEYKSRGYAVEHAIRTAIIDIDKDNYLWQELFPGKKHCSNKDFISAIVEYIRMQRDKEEP